MSAHAQVGARTSWAALGGLFASNLTLTALAVAIPTIAHDLGGSTKTLVWALSGPIVLRAAIGTSIGRLGDLIGRRRVLATGLATCALFTLAIGLAPTDLALVAARLLAAVGAAVIGPMTVALLSEGADDAERGRAMGRFAMVAAGSPALGLVLGGPVVDLIGWRWLFIGQAGLIIGFAALASTTIGDDQRQPVVGFDVGGAALLGVGLGGVLVTVTSTSHPAAPTLPVAVGAASATALLLFVRRQRSHATPLIPLDRLARRPFALPAAILALSAFGYMGGFILTPLLLQGVFGFSATETSLLSVTRPVAFAVAGPLAGHLLPRWGTRSVLAAGAFGVAVSLVLLSGAALAESEALVLIALALSGLGQGSAMTSVSAAVASSVEPGELGVAAAAQQTAEMVGVSVGIQTMATVAESAGNTAGAFAGAYGLGAAGALCAALLAAGPAWPPSPKGECPSGT